jgi:hypothetical protein
LFICSEIALNNQLQKQQMTIDELIGRLNESQQAMKYDYEQVLIDNEQFKVNNCNLLDETNSIAAQNERVSQLCDKLMNENGLIIEK